MKPLVHTKITLLCNGRETHRGASRSTRRQNIATWTKSRRRWRRRRRQSKGRCDECLEHRAVSHSVYWRWSTTQPHCHLQARGLPQAFSTTASGWVRLCYINRLSIVQSLANSCFDLDVFSHGILLIRAIRLRLLVGYEALPSFESIARCRYIINRWSRCITTRPPQLNWRLIFDNHQVRHPGGRNVGSLNRKSTKNKEIITNH